MNSANKPNVSLNKVSNRLVLIVNVDQEKGPETTPQEQLQAYKNSLLSYNAFNFVATAIHDKDSHEDGTPKTIHLHAFIEAKVSATLSKWLKEIAELLNVRKELITIDTSNSEYLMVQYLTHKNAPEKQQYDRAIIETNNEEELSRRYDMDYTAPVDPVQEALLNCKTLTELMMTTGPKTANQFRGLFKDLHAENLQIIAYHELETQYLALKRFVSELLQHLMLTHGRLENLKYWLDEAEKLDIYDIVDSINH